MSSAEVVGVVSLIRSCAGGPRDELAIVCQSTFVQHTSSQASSECCKPVKGNIEGVERGETHERLWLKT
jgi:hypothetical protein